MLKKMKSEDGRGSSAPAVFFILTTLLLVLLACNRATANTELLAQLQQEHALLLGLLHQRDTPTSYIVIDTHDNRLQVRSPDDEVIQQAVCSTGAGRRFEGPRPRKNQRWRFATPPGRFAVIRKVADPIWSKPDWQFLEAGERIPIFAEDPRRFQPAVLGEYALHFAKDYMIHGTLYEVNLGRNMTHGCVRVGSEDLRQLYEEAEVGWPIYIY
jgi:lipoprotein-anchoring transpeptidase ErfK/SrfK